VLAVALVGSLISVFDLAGKARGLSTISAWFLAIAAVYWMAKYGHYRNALGDGLIGSFANWWIFYGLLVLATVANLFATRQADTR
jgi:hypothetical protein